MTTPKEERRLADGSPDHPDLPFKPPFAFLGAIVVGAVLDLKWPMHARPAEWMPLGVTLVLLGAALLVWAKRSFDAQRTPLEPWKATKAIVDAGPFAYSRNPVYIAFGIIQLGIGIWSDVAAVALLVPVPMVLIDRLVVTREETYLRKKFGAVYEDYCSRVRRWV